MYSRAEQLLELGRPELGRQLLVSALFRVFVGTPANDRSPMTETSARDLIVAHFDDELRLQRLPLAGTLGVPPARTARRIPGEARRLDQPLKVSRQLVPLLCGNRGCEADVIEQAPLVIEAQQEGADYLLLLSVEESADDAVSRALLFHLDHRALAGAIFEVAPLGDDAVERSATALEPGYCGLSVASD